MPIKSIDDTGLFIFFNLVLRLKYFLRHVLDLKFLDVLDISTVFFNSKQYFSRRIEQN